MRNVHRFPRKPCPCIISALQTPEQPRLFYGTQLTTRMKCYARRFFFADLDFDSKRVFIVLDTAKSGAYSRVSHICGHAPGCIAFSCRWSELNHSVFWAISFRLYSIPL